MVRAKAKISEKSLDVLKATKKAGSKKKKGEPKVQAISARTSRSRSRTPGRAQKTPAVVSPPPKAKTPKPKKAARPKKAPKRLGQTPASEKKPHVATGRPRGRPSTANKASKSPAEKRRSPPKKVTPKPRKTPTRASTRASTANSSQATAYTLRNKVTIDDTDVTPSRSRSNLSISSKASSGGGWFSKCSIV